MTCAGGKSTVASLVTRLYAPTSGTISMDGRDMQVSEPCWCPVYVTPLSGSGSSIYSREHGNSVAGASLVLRVSGSIWQYLAMPCNALQIWQCLAARVLSGSLAARFEKTLSMEWILSDAPRRL